MTAPAFKRVTPENWLDADPSMNVSDVRDEAVHVEAQGWIAFVNGLHLSPFIPEDVREAFHFATGAVGYAYFYSPIFTLMSQQILRVADFAIDRLFDRRGIVPKPERFSERIAVLAKRGLLSEAEANRWDGIRRLRNSATHPKFQEDWGQGMSFELIRTVATAIGNLPWNATK